MTAIRVGTLPDVAPATMPGELPVYGTLEAAQAAGALPEEPTKKARGAIKVGTIDMTAPVMMNETVVPKGGVPQQLTQPQSEAFAQYDLENIARRQMQQARAEEAAKGGGVGAFTANLLRSGRKEFSDALLATPGALLDVGAYPSRAISSLYSGGGLPGLSKFPKPSVDDIAAFLRSGTGSMTQEQARQNIDLAEGAREAERGTSTTLGKVGGDIATVLTGRLPIARFTVAAQRIPPMMEAARAAAYTMPPGVLRRAQIVWETEIAQHLRRAGVKAAETGLEGATLSYLHEGDAVKAGAMSTAGQVTGSMALGAIRHPFYSLGAIGSGAVMWQMFKDAIPGGKDRITDSIEHATRIATGGTILGGLAALFGAGRFRGSRSVIPGAKNPIWDYRFAQDLPRYAEGVNAALRTGPNSLIQQFTNDDKSDNPILGPVMDKLSINPKAFTSKEIQRLSRAITSGNLRSTVESMLKDENFAARMGF